MGGLSYWGNVASIPDVQAIFNGVPLVTGDITSISSIDLLEQTVTVSGKCHSNKLNKAKTTEQVMNKSAKSAIETFASRHGLTLKMSGGSSEQMGNKYQIDTNDLTHGETEWDAIHRYLDREGLAGWVSNKTLNIAPIGQTTGGVTIVYKQGIIVSANAFHVTFSRDLDIAAGVTTNVKSWHSKQAKVIESKQTYAGGGTPLVFNYHAPDLTQAQADKLAKSHHKKNTSHELKAEITREGDETADVAHGVTISGTGTVFDTTYEITSLTDSATEHGYTQSLSVTAGKSK
jgi:hypothetical protein